jgi:hypothetical protein
MFFASGDENGDDFHATLNVIRMEEVDCFWYLGVDGNGGIKNERKHRVSETKLVVFRGRYGKEKTCQGMLGEVCTWCPLNTGQLKK